MQKPQVGVAFFLTRSKPMTRGEYSKLRGWALPADENGDDEGWLIEYIHDGKSNHPDCEGLISWVQKGVIKKSGEGVMSFSLALELLKNGYRVCRRGWNGKGMWLVLVIPEDDDTPHEGPGYSLWRMQGIVGHALPWIGMRTADDKFVPWLASQTDMLADDWMVAH